MKDADETECQVGRRDHGRREEEAQEERARLPCPEPG
jgi:hypothetical protein